MNETTQQAERAGFLPVRPDGILEELKSYPAWVLWRNEEELGKVPYCAGDPTYKASTRDLRTWSYFEEAMLAYEADKGIHGIGYVFSSGDKFAGIDLDDVRDPETGELEAWAEQRLEAARVLGAYCELSASGTGVHLIGRFEKLLEGGKKGPVEVYTHCRFFACTGWTI